MWPCGSPHPPPASWAPGGGTSHSIESGPKRDMMGAGPQVQLDLTSHAEVTWAALLSVYNSELTTPALGLGRAEEGVGGNKSDSETQGWGCRGPPVASPPAPGVWPRWHLPEGPATYLKPWGQTHV